ncbi:MAG TPA: DUF3592 domain-containing protein [Leptospiraceae bacterium]|nr:DUF3592 domain-containing protein [Leptospiraceae bacterium]HRG76082.1 DUF3592 domain-containing protein [Leptospiraceae bacterium]
MKLFQIRKIRLLITVLFASLYCTFPVKSELNTTTGKIIHREIYTSGFSNSTRYHVLIKYIYEVNGSKFESSRIGYMKFFYSTRESAEKSIELYQLEKPVTVYYMATDPEQSYLEVDD